MYISLLFNILIFVPELDVYMRMAFVPVDRGCIFKAVQWYVYFFANIRHLCTYQLAPLFRVVITHPHSVFFRKGNYRAVSNSAGLCLGFHIARQFLQAFNILGFFTVHNPEQAMLHMCVKDNARPPADILHMGLVALRRVTGMRADNPQLKDNCAYVLPPSAPVIFVKTPPADELT